LRAKSDEVGSVVEWSGMTFSSKLCAAIRHWGWRHGVIAPPS
jgi:hypothetical protein